MAVTPCSAKKTAASQGRPLRRSMQAPRKGAESVSEGCPTEQEPNCSTCSFCWAPTEGAFLSVVGRGRKLTERQPRQHLNPRPCSAFRGLGWQLHSPSALSFDALVRGEHTAVAPAPASRRPVQSFRRHKSCHAGHNPGHHPLSAGPAQREGKAPSDAGGHCGERHGVCVFDAGIPLHFTLGALRGPLEHFSNSGQHSPRPPPRL